MDTNSLEDHLVISIKIIYVHSILDRNFTSRIYPIDRFHVHKDTCRYMFTEALLEIAKDWN